MAADRAWLIRMSVLATILVMLFCALSNPQAAQAATSSPAMSSATLGDRVLNKAETKYGNWYSFGAAGPTYFDCSGLVYWSARQLGITLPRDTYGMLAGSAHLYRISLSQIRRGDLVFYGSGHVEINTAWPHTSFGAHRSGTRVGWQTWSSYYHPTMAMRLRLRGERAPVTPTPRGSQTGARHHRWNMPERNFFTCRRVRTGPGGGRWPCR
jgi:hypothetical protein